MTVDKHQKRRIRELAARMGCSYTTAREIFLRTDRQPDSADMVLSDFQSSATQLELLALGSAAHRLICTPLPEDRLPTEEARALEVTLLWGDTLIDVRCFEPGKPVTIGPDERADFKVYDDAIPKPFELFANGCVGTPPGAQLAVAHDEDLLEPAGADCPLGLDDRALLSLSTTHLVLRWVKPGVRFADRRFDALDLYFTRVLSTTFLLHLLLLAALWISPVTTEQLGENPFGPTPPTLTKALVTPPKPIPKTTYVLTPAANPASHDPRPAPRPASVTRTRAPAGGHSQVMRAGLLDGVNMSALLSHGADQVGAALGALKGPRFGDLGGHGNFGSRGNGPGSGDGPLDIGGIGTGGIGRGPAGALAFGNGHKATLIVDRTPTHLEGGGLPKDVIASIIHKHENEIRYCYESALNGHPDLYGKVAVAFVIAGTGEVSEANVADSSLANATVEGCITTKIRRWRFPEPKGGGQVFVTYPWIFKPAAAE